MNPSLSAKSDLRVYIKLWEICLTKMINMIIDNHACLSLPAKKGSWISSEKKKV